MNNCRAGLYSFASTTAWLHEIDSRILSGIASIGLTLANIAIILPHLRQPILDSIHALENALAHEQSTKEQTNVSPDRSNATQPVDLDAEHSVLAPVLPSEREHQSPPFTCSTTLKSVRSADTELLGYPNVEPEAAPQMMLLPPEKTDESQTSPQMSHSPDADSGDSHVSPNYLFTREGRGALYIPLPVPDAEEIAFFDSRDDTLSNSDPGEECPAVASERHPTIEYRGLKDRKARIPFANVDGEHGDDNDGQLVTANPSSAQGHVEIKNSTDRTTVASGQRTMAEVVPPPTAMIRDRHEPVAEGTVSDSPHGLPTRGGAVQSAQEKYSSVAGKEAVTKRRPESLEFIPQSVIRRYPSAGHCFGHRAFGLGHDYQFPLAPPMLLEGARPRATYTTLEGPWRASFFTGIHPTRQSMGGQAFVIETASVEQESTSLSKRAATHESSPLRKRPARRRRLGVLARAALRDRRFTARRHRNDGSDGSSTSDSDSDFESDSEYSSGSSADESILPRILGTDLIAAIDANSEPDLNLVASKRTKRTPLNLYEEFLISEDSTADVSMVMQVSSYDDASDGEVIAPAFRSLTDEDIQQWVSGVVQKCVRQVCRSRVHAEPSSPSQASDVCAERPSGSGVSQCPLSGLHCKVGAVALTESPAPKTKGLPVSFPLTSIQPSRKALQVRNLRDIPEFVPRQRYVSMTTGRLEGPGRFDTRSSVDIAHDAAARVIAKMENQAGFNTRQRLVGTEEKRMVNMAGGRQGTLRCA